MIKRHLSSAVDSVLDWPVIVWVLPVFVTAYLLFFIRPVFFSSGVMQFYRYLPIMDPIGADLRETLTFSASWLVAHQTPYIGSNAYPPLASVFFSPLIFASAPTAYATITMLSLACFGWMTSVLPLLAAETKRLSAIQLLILASGLLSYGLQFELERGQFNVIASAACLAAVYIYHKHYHQRWLAYFLFTVSVQLKLYPFLLVIMLIGDWRAWRDNIRRLLGLALVNAGLLVALGPRILLDFLGHVRYSSDAPPLWIYNHSVRAFVGMASSRVATRHWTWQAPLSGSLEVVLLLLVLGCLLVIALQALRKKQPGPNEHLLLACAIAVLVLPPISNDYTLSILAGPVAVVLVRIGEGPWRRGRSRLQQAVAIVAVIGLVSAFACTLFPPNYKPHTLWLENAFPALLSMLLATTVLHMLSGASPGARSEQGQQPE